jgi:hypothetical protein
VQDVRHQNIFFSRWDFPHDFHGNTGAAAKRHSAGNAIRNIFVGDNRRSYVVVGLEVVVGRWSLVDSRSLAAFS